jgi:tRNA (adenine22-N1)-methyltransferase
MQEPSANHCRRSMRDRGYLLTGLTGEARAPWPGRRRGTERVRAIIDLLNPALPVWDLCCDHGHIGCAALEQYPVTQVVFVDKAMRTVGRLERSLRRYSRLAGRYRMVCADVIQMELPAAPVNFVVAGVSSRVIGAFLSRLVSRRGDRIICNTFQNAARFEARSLAVGLAIDKSFDVATRSGIQRLWLLRT